MTRVEREANLDGAFSLSADGDLEGLSVLLVDDTLTTGATLHAAAATLLDAGVAVVQPTAVARAALRRDEEQPDAVSVISSHTASFYHDSPVLGYHL